MILPHLKCLDLTHTLCSDISHWTGDCGFKLTQLLDYQDSQTETKFRAHEITMFAGIGTHLDSPRHCFKDGTDVANLQLEQLISPCVKIDIEKKAEMLYRLSVDDILEFEKSFGKINKNTFVIIRTGWDRFWNDPVKFRNELKFPTVSAEAAELLLERGISGLGIDTLSPDIPMNDFPVHRLLLGAGKYIIENVANTSYLPSLGAYTLALPLKIKDGTESPVRMIALL